MELEPKALGCSTFYHGGAERRSPYGLSCKSDSGDLGEGGGQGQSGGGPRDKDPPHLRVAASSSRRQAVENTHEVTSRALPAGRRPLTGWRGGTPRLATPPAAVSLVVWTEPAGLGSACTSAPSRLIHIYEPVGAGPGSPSAPRPRPGIPPRRRLKPQRGAPGFRFGEGVSTWSRLKNVSRPLLPAPGCVCGVSSMRGKEQRLRKGLLLSPGKGRRKRGVDSRLAV